MFDARLRPLIDPPLARAASWLARLGVTANEVTVAGFLVGISAVPFLAFQQYDAALVLILTNRLMDGLDGAVARLNGVSDIGGYLDIVLDFIFYSAVIFGFLLGRPHDAVYGAFLIFSFIGTGSSFLAYSVFAAKRGISTQIRGRKSIYYLGGLTEGFETIVAFVLLCLFPDQFWLIALIFGIMCWITTTFRITWAFQTLR